MNPVSTDGMGTQAGDSYPTTQYPYSHINVVVLLSTPQLCMVQAVETINTQLTSQLLLELDKL